MALQSKQLKQPMGVSNNFAATSGSKQPVFGTQFYKTASVTILSAERRGCHGVVGSLLQGSFRLLLQSHKIKADLEIAIFKLTLLMYIIKLK